MLRVQRKLEAKEAKREAKWREETNNFPVAIRQAELAELMVSTVSKTKA
jgi:hypothetical protein